MGAYGELLTELVSSSTSLLGEVNQHILACPEEAAPRYPLRVGGSRPGVDGQAVLSTCRWALTVLGHLDASLELAAAAMGGEQTRLNVITSIEVLRAVLKVAVLLTSGSRHLIRGGQAHLDLRAQGVAASRARAATAYARRQVAPQGPESPEPAQPTPSTSPAAPSEVLPALQPAPASQPEQPADAQPPTFDATPAQEVVPPVWVAGPRSGMRLPVSAATRAAAAGAAASGSFPNLAETPQVAALRMLGELLHIARPLVHTLSMRAWGSRAWAPLLLSAGLDLASWQASEAAAVQGGAGPAWCDGPPSLLDALLGRGHLADMSVKTEPGGDPAPTGFAGVVANVALRMLCWASMGALAPLGGQESGRCLAPEEEQELASRRRAWALYLLRSPLFHQVTQPAAQRVADAAGYVPLLGWVAQFAVGMLAYYNRVHFYNSGSAN